MRSPRNVDFHVGVRFIEIGQNKLPAGDCRVDLNNRSSADKNASARREGDRSGFLVGFDVRSCDVGRESPAGIQPQDPVIKPAGTLAVENDQGLAGDLRQFQGPAACQRMRFRQDDDESLFKDGFAVQVHGIDWRAQESHIYLSPTQSFVLIAGEDVLALNIEGRKQILVFHDSAADRSSQSSANTDSETES